MPVIIVAMEDVLENIGEVFDKLFVDKEVQNLLVDVFTRTVRSIFKKLITIQN